MITAEPDQVPEASIKQQAIGGILWMGGSRLGTRLIDQLFTIFLVRILAPGDFGLLAMAAVFTTLFNLFSDMGISRAVIQRAEVDDEYLSTAFWGNMASGAVLCAFALGTAPLVARFYQQPLTGPVFAALSLRFLFAGANVTQSAILTRELRFATITVRSIVSFIVGGAVGVGMALAGMGVWSLVGQALTTAFVGTLVLWFATPWRPRFQFSWTKFKVLWHFGSRILGAQVFHYVIKQTDNFLIGRVLGPTLLGFYAFAYGMFLTPLIEMGLIFGRVVFATFSRLQGDVGRIRRGFLLATTYMSFVALPALIGMFLVAPDMIVVVFSEKWRPAIPVVRVLLIAGLFQFPTSLWQAVLMSLGRAGWLLKWSAASAALYVPAFYIGLRWGIVGVAVGYTVSTVVLIPVLLSLVQRLIGFRMREYAAANAGVLAASAVMGICVHLSRLALSGEGVHAAVRLTVAVAVGVISYLIAVALIQRQLLTGLIRMVGDLRQPRRARRPRLAKEVVKA